MKAIIPLTSALGVVLALLMEVTIGSAQVQPPLRLLIYGLPDFERQNSRYVIAQKWGIEFYPVAGCMVTHELEDSVARENKKVEPLIEVKFGKDWRDKFDAEVDSEFAIEVKVSAIIDSLDYIRKKQAEMDKEGNGLHYWMKPVAKTTNYDVLVQGWGRWKGKDEWVTYYKERVDYKSKTVKLLSDKVAKD